jgi:hypothetical protein
MCFLLNKLMSKKISQYKGELGFRFVSDPIPITGTALATQTIAHGLEGVPGLIRAVWACIADDAGWGLVEGQEIEVSAVSPPTRIFADETNIYVVPTLNAMYVGHESSVSSFTGMGGASSSVGNPTSLANFVLKVYAYK